jgi:hypothetical protein
MTDIAGQKPEKLDLIEKIYVTILLVIFGGIVLHAPLTVGLGTLWPHYVLLIKSWKEILMIIAGFMALFLMYRYHQFKKILRDPVIKAIAVYAVLHLVLLMYKPTGFAASLAGLMIDLRYVLFFALVYTAMRLYPQYRKTFIRVGIGGALIVLIFAILQVFILPHDVLKYIGYNLNTISPYLTIDKNQAFVRINSTLRGPNPLGAYACIALTLLVAVIAKKKVDKKKWPIAIFVILSVGGMVALWASYSRSAQIGAIIAILIVLAATFWHKLSIKVWIAAGILLVVLGGGLYMARDTSFVSNVILHVNPTGGSSTKSDEGHISSLSEGLKQLVRQPMGGGIGSTGSASLLSNKSEVIENQYLFTAHEAGWLGLAVFMFIFVAILVRLWRLRNDWLALGVFASGIGLAIIGILLPVWTDDAVSIIWWGLAAVVVGNWRLGNGKLEKGIKQGQKVIIK